MASYIDVRIPYEPAKRLGYAYNRAMHTVEDWVLFLDHDVYLLNPHWYEMLLEAIDQAGHRAGWISCVTNGIGCRAQKWQGVQPGDADSLAHQEEISYSLWKRHGSTIYEHTQPKERLSGFFILTHKDAWIEVKGFREERGKQFLGVDNDYHRRLVEHGYKIYIMPGLYVYHGYKRHWKPESIWQRPSLRKENLNG